MKKNNFSKRGVTLAETIVAIALIAIVSVMAVSICIYSYNQENKNLRDMRIASISSTAVDCFRFADTEEEFLSLLKKTDENFKKEEEKILLEGGDYILTLNISENVLSLLAVDKQDVEIYSLTYKKQI